MIDDSESLLLNQKFTSPKKEKITETKKEEDKTVFAKTEKKTTQQDANLLAKNKYVVQLIAYGNKNMAEKLQKILFFQLIFLLQNSTIKPITVFV